MRAKKFSLVFSVLVCLLPTVCVPLSAQQPGPPISQRVTTAPPGAEARNSTPAQKLARQCREFLASEEKLQSRFEVTTDDELASIAKRAMRCGELPDVSLLRAAFVAYRIVRDEQEARASRDSERVFTSMADMQQEDREKHKAQIEKQRADFAEVANFAAALYKEKELYLDGEVKCFRAYMDLQDRYSATYNLAENAIHLAEKSLDRSVGLSLPVFLNVPAPQVIRVEPPPVPRSLYCTTSSTPNLSLSPMLSTSTTWTNCHW